MALQGTLDTVPLPDVLSLLASTAKVGRLRVDGPDHEGTLWVDGPNIVGAACGERTGVVEVLVELLRLDEGAFRFDPGEVPSGQPVRHPIDDALAEATTWLAEWLDVEEVLPSPDHGLRLRPVIDDPEVTITAERWAALAAIAEGGTIRDLLPRFGATELEAARVLAAVVGTGLVQVLTPEPGVAWASWGATSSRRPAPEAEPEPQPEPVPVEVDVDPDALGNGQPWRDQVRQLLGTANVGEEPPAPVPLPAESAPSAPADGDRDVLLKFLSSVQP